MTVDELKAMCKDQIDHYNGDTITLVLPGRWGVKDTRRLCPGGPIGRILTDANCGPGILVRFDAREVLDYINTSEGGEW